MAVLRWIKMSLLLTLTPQSTAQIQKQPAYFTVTVGNEVTLPCGNKNVTQHSSETIWVFGDAKDKSKTTKLVQLGNSHKELKTISDKLSVTADCSLVLSNVTVNDVGQYNCQQTISGQLRHFLVYLSIINMVEQKNPDTVTWFCSVLEYDHCLHEVEWLYEGREEKPSDMAIIKHSCSATVTFPTSYLHQQLDIYRPLTCKVTNGVTKVAQKFPFSLQSSGGHLTKTTKAIEKQTNSSVPTSMPQTGLSWWYIIIPLCLAVLLSAVVLVIIRWRQTKGNESQVKASGMSHYEVAIKPDLSPDSTGATAVPQTSQKETDPGEGVSYASFSFNETKRKPGNVETVVYSTVNTSSPSAGVFSDTNTLYSTVNKNWKL